MSVYSFLFLAIIFLLFLFRGGYKAFQGKDYNFLFVSFFLISIPFEIAKTVVSVDKDVIFGTLGSELRVNIFNFITVLFVLVNRKICLSSLLQIPFFKGVFLLILVSLLIPANNNIFGTIIFLYLIVSLTVLFSLFTSILSYKQVVKGIYDGLMILVILQFILSICFPVLNISSVTKVFHESAEYWSTRGGNRVGAVGFFKHPGNLGLFVTLASTFFLASYLTRYRTRSSLLLLGMSVVIVFLTFSRTSYITFIITSSVIFFYHFFGKKREVNVKSLIKIILPIGLFIYWVIFLSPFATTFLKSDANEQIDNRFLHYIMGQQVFFKSPFFGVGFNSHLNFINQDYDIQILDPTSYSFFISNPIHNIHLIILAEVGLIGFVLWLIFIRRSFIQSRYLVYQRKFSLVALSFVGVLVCYCLYGMTGWAPLSYSIFPYFLFFVWIFGICNSSTIYKTKMR